MTWKELKDAVEAKGIKDEDAILYIQVTKIGFKDIEIAGYTHCFGSLVYGEKAEPPYIISGY